MKKFLIFIFIIFILISPVSAYDYLDSAALIDAGDQIHNTGLYDILFEYHGSLKIISIFSLDLIYPGETPEGNDI